MKQFTFEASACAIYILKNYLQCTFKRICLIRKHGINVIKQRMNYSEEFVSISRELYVSGTWEGGQSFAVEYSSELASHTTEF